MKINVKVLGTGCSSCHKLYKDITEVISELKIDANLEKIENIEQIMAYSIMGLPALVVNEKVKFYGKSPNKEELKKYLTSDIEPDNQCSCCCDCTK
ncbi:MAG: thioredoxin family protein [Bacilli bacterium]|nr:thioredoxin family protein [Bacilli bacterium]MDD4407103.1 thioredoxin family protein [Bacilli bacterium]